MKPSVVRICGLVMLMLVLSAGALSAQDAAGGTPQLRWSIEGAAGVQLDYTGTIQSVAFGFAPTRSLTLLISAERSRTEDEIEFYYDGYASERGGLVEFVSAELRYAFFAHKRVSPTRWSAPAGVSSDRTSTSSSRTASIARSSRSTTTPARAFRSTGASTRSPTGD